MIETLETILGHGLFRIIFLSAFSLTCILFVALIILTVASTNFLLEIYCLRIIIFCLCPLFVGLTNFFVKLPLSPLLTVFILWGLAAWILIKSIAKKKTEETKYIKEHNLWRCKKCGTLNESLLMVCLKCDAEKE